MLPSTGGETKKASVQACFPTFKLPGRGEYGSLRESADIVYHYTLPQIGNSDGLICTVPGETLHR
jgi:hypothetical protein